MKRTKKLLSLLLCAFLIVGTLCACRNNKDSGGTTDSTQTSSNEAVQAVLSQSVAEPDLTNATKITLSDTNINISGSGAEEKDGTVTITEGGTYVFSGSLSNGRIVVNAPDKEVTVVLNGADITCSYSSPLYAYKASSATVYLLKDTENKLTDGESYTYSDSYSSSEDEEPNACLYSKSDLIIAGAGSLTVNANFNNSITSKDTLRIDSASITVNAKNHGINGKDYLTLKNAKVSVTSGGDALRSTNDSDETLGYITSVNSDLTLVSGEDGMQAETVMTISGGNINIKSGGGSGAKMSGDASAKGIKAGKNIAILDGTFIFDCCDDALHSNSGAEISGGTFAISTGDDGVHADKNLKISGGTINISKSYEGLEGATIDISGGKITITASDDGINAAGGNDESGFGGGMARDTFGSSSSYYINISGGTINIDASGDGIDSNGNLTVSGGEIYVSGPISGGDSALDYDGTAAITGGIVIAAGSSGMAQNFGDSSTQGSIMLTYQSFASGKISVADSSGNVLAEYMPSKNYSCVVVSCPGLTKGGTYTVTACGQSQSVTLDSIIYGSGSMGGGQGGQGGQQPGGTPPDGDPGQQNDGSGNSGSRPTPPDGDPRQNNSAQSGQKSSSQSANQNTQTA